MVEARIDFHSTFRPLSICHPQPRSNQDDDSSSSPPSPDPSSPFPSRSICEMIPHAKLNCRVEIVNLTGNLHSGLPDVLSSEVFFQDGQSSSLRFTLGEPEPLYRQEDKAYDDDNVENGDRLPDLDVFVQDCQFTMSPNHNDGNNGQNHPLHLLRQVSVIPFPTYFQLSPNYWNVVQVQGEDVEGEESKFLIDIDVPLHVTFDFDSIGVLAHDHYQYDPPPRRTATNPSSDYQQFVHHRHYPPLVRHMQHDPFETILVIMLGIMMVIFLDLMIFLLGEPKPKPGSYPKLLGLMRCVVLCICSSVNWYMSIGRSSLVRLVSNTIDLFVSVGACCVRNAKAAWSFLYCNLPILMIGKVKTLGSFFVIVIHFQLSILLKFPRALVLKLQNAGVQLKSHISGWMQRFSLAFQFMKCNMLLATRKFRSSEGNTEDDILYCNLKTPENTKKDACPSVCDVTQEHTTAKSCLLLPSSQMLVSPSGSPTDTDTDIRTHTPSCIRSTSHAKGSSLFHPNNENVEHSNRHIVSPVSVRYRNTRDIREAQLSMYESMMISSIKPTQSIPKHGFCRDETSSPLMMGGKKRSLPVIEDDSVGEQDDNVSDNGGLSDDYDDETPSSVCIDVLPLCGNASAACASENSIDTAKTILQSCMDVSPRLDVKDEVVTNMVGCADERASFVSKCETDNLALDVCNSDSSIGENASSQCETSYDTANVSPKVTERMFKSAVEISGSFDTTSTNVGSSLIDSIAISEQDTNAESHSIKDVQCAENIIPRDSQAGANVHVHLDNSCDNALNQSELRSVDDEGFKGDVLSPVYASHQNISEFCKDEEQSASKVIEVEAPSTMIKTRREQCAETGTQLSPHFLPKVESSRSPMTFSGDGASGPTVDSSKLDHNSSEHANLQKDQHLNSPLQATADYESVQKELFVKLKSRNKIDEEGHAVLPYEPLSPCSKLEHHMLQRKARPGKLNVPDLFKRNKDEPSAISSKLIKPMSCTKKASKNNFSLLVAKWGDKNIDFDSKTMNSSQQCKSKCKKISSPFLDEDCIRGEKSRKIKPLEDGAVLRTEGSMNGRGNLQESPLSFLDDMLG